MWILVVAIVALGITAFLLSYFKIAHRTESPVVEEEECCGQHATCEKDSLLAGVSQSIEYFDDEELDQYSQQDPHSYDDEALMRFEEVFLTLQDDDVAAWLRSLQLRGISLPETIRQDALMVVSELRDSRTTADLAGAES